jgi:hypothetical protein
MCGHSSDPVEALAAVIAEHGDDRIKAALSEFIALPADAQAAAKARMVARARGFFNVKEFAAVIGRHNQFVSDRCSARVIRTLKGGKPYRIPLSEDDVWNKVIY